MGGMIPAVRAFVYESAIGVVLIAGLPPPALSLVLEDRELEAPFQLV